MRPVVFVVPGRLETRTGGYIYDRRMAEGLARLGWPVQVREIDDGFPNPTPAALEHAARVLAAVAAGTIVVVDGLAFGAMPDVLVRAASRLRIVALVHLPLAAEVGLDRAAAARFERLERRAFGTAALVVVTGRATLPLLEPYGLPRARVVVVEPGTDRAPLSRGVSAWPLALLSVATLNPGKGHESLLSALSAVPHREWHLTCAGSLTRHPATVERVRAAIRDLGLDDRVSLAGDLDRPALAERYAQAGLFVLASRQETYGMAVAEALACGLPVVSTATGAIPDLTAGDAGVLVPPGDTPALAAALSRVLGDADFRARLAEGARRARLRLPTWTDAARTMAVALESMARS